MTKELFALLLAGTLLVPHITPALGNGGTVGLGVQGQRQPQAGSWGTLSLPPLPHLESMPWLATDSFLKGPQVDVLLGPKIETLGPFLLGPSTPASQSSLIAATPEPQATDDLAR